MKRTLIPAVLAATVVLTVAVPLSAQAHHNTINVSVACSHGFAWVASWSVENSENLVETVTASSDAVLVPVGSQLGKKATVTFTETFAAPVAKTLTLSSKWSNGNTATNSGYLTVDKFVGTCTPPVIIPPEPPTKVTYSDWVDEGNDCTRDTIAQHRGRTTVTYTYDAVSNSWTEHVATVTEDGTRPKTAAEVTECAPPPVDVCPNVDGDQTVIPDGYELVDGQCALIPVPPVDPPVCADGEELSNGVCVPADLPNPDPTFQPQPHRLATTGVDDGNWYAIGAALLALLVGIPLVAVKIRKGKKA